MEKKNILLLVLSPERLSRTCIEEAVKIAFEEKMDLYVNYIITTGEKQFVTKRIKQMGFLGTDPVNQVKETIEKSEKQRAEQVFKILEDIAKKFKIIISEKKIISGDFYKSVKNIVEEIMPGKIVLTRAHWNWLEKKWFGSVVDKFLREIDSHIIVVKRNKREQIL